MLTWFCLPFFFSREIFLSLVKIPYCTWNVAGRKTAWNIACWSFSHTNINTVVCKYRQVSMTLFILTSYSGIFSNTRSVRRILFQQKCNSVELDELFMNLNWEVQASSISYSHNSWCIHPQELLCAERVGWIQERSSIEHPSLFWPLVEPYFWHQFQSIKFPLHFFLLLVLIFEQSQDHSDFWFLEERRYLFKSFRPDISATGILLSWEHISVWTDSFKIDNSVFLVIVSLRVPSSFSCCLIQPIHQCPANEAFLRRFPNMLQMHWQWILTLLLTSWITIPVQGMHYLNHYNTTFPLLLYMTTNP